ncbi:formate--phosphoribosylaminoimidazolecarboxamide ligase [Candidatus Daviesbacteria bacterium]|nr:formate--phosphoribosylaminoimidazolecarboxamide ligase [Candidatus Daviesbacteria bacterium]
MGKREPVIATLGSHSALQILKGAKDENFPTLVIAPEDKKDFYKRFRFIDEIISIPNYLDFPKIEKLLFKKNVILIPHGSFVAYLGLEENKKMRIPYFGNREVLDYESDRQKQREWLIKSDINVPLQFRGVADINYPVIVKSYGAAGGKGYFYAKNKRDFQKKIGALKDRNFIIQEYVIGVTLYIHYFYSLLTNKLEILSMDRRYETNVDSLGRIPLTHQEQLNIEPSYVVVGNSPLVLRESLLPEAFAMGERVVEKSKQLIGGKGLYGPFCLETVITPDQKFYVIEISCRIVAGTNLFMDGSPYSSLIYNEPMSTGRRIAREIKLALKENKLEQVLN